MLPEAPLEIAPDGIQPARRKTGHARLDFIVSGAAIVISLVSLFVAYLNARNEERMVAASSWPFLVYTTDRNSGAPRPATIKMRIENEGVGPARLKSLIVRYRGKPVHGFVELLQVCCGLKRGIAPEKLLELGLMEESQAVGIYSPREGTTILQISRRDPDLWDKLAIARLHLDMKACYCSVLGECWLSDLRSNTDPVSVGRCDVTNPDNYRE